MLMHHVAEWQSEHTVRKKNESINKSNMLRGYAHKSQDIALLGSAPGPVDEYSAVHRNKSALCIQLYITSSSKCFITFC